MSHSPFPGMDPYLEAPNLWLEVHNNLINIFIEQLSPLLAPKYFARLETKSVNRDDIALEAMAKTNFASTRVTGMSVRCAGTEDLVTIIELLSPIDKYPGKNREQYEKKRFTLLDSFYVHFIEIDLLRYGMPMVYDCKLTNYDYIAMVSRTYQRQINEVWPIRIREPLPVLPVPLQRRGRDVPLDLGKALRTVYERAHYGLRIDYRFPPIPPLEPDDAEWAKNRVKSKLIKC